MSAADEIGLVSADDAREALDSLDDYARMTTGVDAVGPRRTLEAFISQTEAEPPPAEYGSTDLGYDIVGVPVTDGDKRLMKLVTDALGNDHPAFNDLMALVMTARSKVPPRSQQMAAAGITRRPGLWALDARAALELIAAPMRPDGTWNRSREACQQLAAEVLGRDGGAPTTDTQGT